MQVKQVYELVNTATSEALGKEGLVKEDLQNVIDIGTDLFNANAVDSYVKSLVNHIGKVIFVNRTYQGRAPRVLMDSWEFGSVLEKVQMDLPQAQENESFQLIDGVSYDTNLFYKPSISAKFFNNKVTFEVPISITEMQVKQSFSNATQLNAFVSMIYNAVERTFTLKLDSLIMRTINNFIGETIFNEYPSGDYSTSSGKRAVNLLYKYKLATGDTSLTVDKALSSTSFLKYASKEIMLYIERMRIMSSIFNIGGKDRFTPRDMMHVVMLTDFTKASDVYLQADTYHNELTKLPLYEEVAYFQGTGTDYSFSDVSKIDVTTANGHDVAIGGILGVIFDRDALGVTNYDRRVTTNYNAKAEFFNNYYKYDAGYFNDFNENFVVFFIA